jgi:poly(glycerol-phosphate) alpha-glucosyltransferase
MISIGNFRPTKRLEEAIRVLNRIGKDNPKAELVLLGRSQDAAYLSKLRDLASELDMAGRVTFVLDATDEQKFALLSESKVLTIHSPVEGFGWTIPEAGLCGVPVVGNAGVPTDTLRDGVNGKRVPFGDVEAYARAVNTLFCDREEWVRYSTNARQVALEFATDVVETEVLTLLTSCADQIEKAESGRKT